MAVSVAKPLAPPPPMEGDDHDSSSSSSSPQRVHRCSSHSRHFESSRVSIQKTKSSLGSQCQTTCISKHYALHQQIYDAFKFHFDNLGKTKIISFDLISGAFCLGWKFVETALIELPQHGYFYSNENQTFVDLRRKSSEQALECTLLLQEIFRLLRRSQQYPAIDTDSDEFSEEISSGTTTKTTAATCSSMSSSSSKTESLLLSKNHSECMEKLQTLKYLAEEQLERLDTYEEKRQEVVSRWKKTNEPSSCSNELMVKDDHGPNNSIAKELTRLPKENTESSISGSFCLLDDCDAMSASLLSCSSFFCPTALSTKPPTTSTSTSRSLEPSFQEHKAPLQELSRNSESLALPKYSPPYMPPSCVRSKQSLIDDDDDDEEEEEREQQIIDARHSKRCKSKPQKSGRKRNPFRVFQKKSKKSSDHELEEALFQSELEFAKETSMREDNNNNIINNYAVVGSGNSASTSGHDYDLQRALYLSGLEVTAENDRPWEDSHLRRSLEEEENRDDAVGPPSSFQVRRQKDSLSDDSIPEPPPGVTVRSRSSMFVSVETLKGCYHDDFNNLRNSGRVIITHVPTHQGRIAKSTNGCTVIAPLLCAHHFERDYENRDDSFGKVSPFERVSITDQVIIDVIDIETPNILPAIRRNLGLSRNAFLIPHDAHESLIEMNHLARDNFLTVCGGNILEESHLDGLIQELSTLHPNGKRLGATFFFHQHVIAILQLRSVADQNNNTTHNNNNNPSAELWFDVIDSLPHDSTLRKELDRDEITTIAPEGIPSNTVRMRCLDRVALKATLQWYACSVFTPENLRYIDAYQWDEKLTDFDPRVFQAFLWKET